MKKLFVFTDLDGTLLDHEDYGYTAALPALLAFMLTNPPYPSFASTRASISPGGPAPRALRSVGWPTG